MLCWLVKKVCIDGLRESWMVIDNSKPRTDGKMPLRFAGPCLIILVPSSLVTFREDTMGSQRFQEPRDADKS